MNLVLFASIMSFFIQNLLAFLKFRKIVNPISIFTVIHFFHNWSFSFSRYFNEFIFWRADNNVTYDTINEVLFINLIGSWAFFTAILLFAKSADYKVYTKLNNLSYLLNGYYALSAISLYRIFINYSSSLPYGADQALDSISAFDPISRLIFFRVIFCSIYLICSKVSIKTFLKILFIEIFFSIITFDRKEILYIVMSFFTKILISSQVNIKNVLKYSAMSISGLIFFTFIPIYRSIDYVDGFRNILNETLVVITNYGSYILFYILNLANSEGVQNWAYQLVENGEMSLLYGKSYLQAFINMFVLRVFQGETISSWQAAYHFKNVAYPNVDNQGWDFTFTAEAIQNFGFTYSFISFLFLGLFISYLYSNRNRSDFIQSLYIFSWPVLIVAFRMDSTSMFRLYSYVFLTFLIFYLTNNTQKIEKEN